jgi:hypothetical protein
MMEFSDFHVEEEEKPLEHQQRCPSRRAWGAEGKRPAQGGFREAQKFRKEGKQHQ